MTSQKNDSNKKRKLLLIVILILSLMLTIILTTCNSKRSTIGINGVTDIIYDDIPNLSENELKELLQRKQDASKFTVQCSSAGTIKKNSQLLNLIVSNPQNNKIELQDLDTNKKEIVDLNCYFEIIFDDEVIYKSPILKPKSYVKEQRLAKALPVGENKVTVKYVVLYNGEKIGTTLVDTIITCK